MTKKADYIYVYRNSEKKRELYSAALLCVEKAFLSIKKYHNYNYIASEMAQKYFVTAISAGVIESLGALKTFMKGIHLAIFEKKLTIIFHSFYALKINIRFVKVAR